MSTPGHAERMARYRARQKAKDPVGFSRRRIAEARKWESANPEKVAAHRAVRTAKNNGLLVRSENCERCGKACKTEASHDDYSRPLDVEWLCRQCHVEKDFG